MALRGLDLALGFRSNPIAVDSLNTYVLPAAIGKAIKPRDRTARHRSVGRMRACSRKLMQERRCCRANLGQLTVATVVELAFGCGSDGNRFPDE
jgi:hypothetical protein